MSTNNEQPLNISEAADFLYIKKSTLYKHTCNRTIPFFKPNGKKIYFKKSDLINWMLRNPVETQSQLEDEAANLPA